MAEFLGMTVTFNKKKARQQMQNASEEIQESANKTYEQVNNSVIAKGREWIVKQAQDAHKVVIDRLKLKKEDDKIEAYEASLVELARTIRYTTSEDEIQIHLQTMQLICEINEQFEDATNRPRVISKDNPFAPPEM